MKQIIFTSLGLVLIMFGAYELFQSWEALKEINASIETMKMMSTMLNTSAEALMQYYDPQEMKQQIYYNLFIYGCVLVGGVTFLLLPQLEKDNQNTQNIPEIKIGENVK